MFIRNCWYVAGWDIAVLPDGTNLPPGSGTPQHLAAELFKMRAAVDLAHVPYKGGGPAAIALMGGEIAMIFGEPATIIQHVKSGKMKAIAVTSAKRALAMPDLPTVQETGIAGYDVTSWNGQLAPAGMPAEIVRRFNSEFNRIITTPEMRKRMIENGYEPMGGSPERFGEHIRSEIAKWAPERLAAIEADLAEIKVREAEEDT